MNRFGNYCTSYDEDVYHYDNADGSKYFSNPDGSTYYDPGDSGKGRKWFRSPDGVKHYMSEEPEGYEKTQQTKDNYWGYDQREPLYWDCRTEDLYSHSPPVAKKQTARRGKPSNYPDQSISRYYEPEEEKEVHVHVPPKRRTSPRPVNVMRVFHHSSKGETEVEYRSPAKVGKDGKIGKRERKVVHLHHHRRESEEREPHTSTSVYFY